MIETLLYMLEPCAWLIPESVIKPSILSHLLFNSLKEMYMYVGVWQTPN